MAGANWRSFEASGPSTGRLAVATTEAEPGPQDGTNAYADPLGGLPEVLWAGIWELEVSSDRHWESSGQTTSSLTQPWAEFPSWGRLTESIRGAGVRATPLLTLTSWARGRAAEA